MRITALLFAFLLVAFVATGCSKPKDPENAEEMRDKLAGKVRLAMWKVSAGKDQWKKMNKLLDVLSVDFFAFQEEDKEIKRSIIEALNADPVDTPALEALQKQGIVLFDRYTQRLLSAAVEVSEILNLEQRRELLELWREYEFNE